MADNITTTVPSGDKVSIAWQFIAGCIMISVTTLAIYFVIAIWPNKMPDPKDGDDAGWYNFKKFNVTLIGKIDSLHIRTNDSPKRNIDTLHVIINHLEDSISTQRSTIDSNTIKDSITKLHGLAGESGKKMEIPAPVDKIHLNTILLLLVALMGFLGNMIHVVTSFTTFIGNGTFKRSWILWYCVKPFTASGLALIVYFIVRGGFLSYGSSAGSVSLFGILSISALAGLFTDSATIKLKEVFEVIFKPNDQRAGKLEGDQISISSIIPDTLATTGITSLQLNGLNLSLVDKITFDGVRVYPDSNSAEKIVLKYTPVTPATGATKTTLAIFDKNGKQVYTRDIPFK